MGISWRPPLPYFRSRPRKSSGVSVRYCFPRALHVGSRNTRGIHSQFTSLLKTGEKELSAIDVLSLRLTATKVNWAHPAPPQAQRLLRQFRRQGENILQGLECSVSRLRNRGAPPARLLLGTGLPPHASGAFLRQPAAAAT